MRASLSYLLQLVHQIKAMQVWEHDLLRLSVFSIGEEYQAAAEGEGEGEEQQ